ncbi:MAG: aldo/keto reductase [Atopobiaceae bacterium]|jgi:predicted aldo/keto reductase-like oxidoreductase|nr:aldo/keto reductase [Atopobiaceae bacterium]MCH4119402.1 aldo/keto reductase [Atopobiaceae bacterium]MCI1318132.1 aldo/keto reductase [Atopobiaceae bacterium]MCI1388989.1 aldo/keto reductase [Atopobiaceae bacterium]MCI1431777.1 aldo/keto reductase [Atopobiaceae bacterium]
MTEEAKGTRAIEEPGLRLGFGLMRLPKLADGHTIDEAQTAKMADMFLGAGGTYFDTAYVYDDGASEEVCGRAIVDRHPRDSFTLATKLNARVAKDAEDARRQLDVSLERTHAGYFDYYLLHSLMLNNHETYDKYGLWDFCRRQREEGRIRHFGFSFHGTPALLERLLDENPDVDFVQLQVNYADWDDPNISSAKNVAICQERHMPFVVMEPVKGGTLATPPEQVARILKEAEPEASLPSWAIRFAASQPGVLVVLSGMSDVAQMADNLSFMRDFKPLTSEELAVIDKARAELSKLDLIRCTGCSYCTKGCPVGMQIPDIFKAMNTYLMGGEAPARRSYGFAVPRAHASDCLACGQCEAACPQHLPIIENLRRCAEVFD